MLCICKLIHLHIIVNRAYNEFVDIGIILAIIAAIGGPLVAYLIGAKKLSGRINTSEAGMLWEEARNLRSEYKTEVGDLRDIVVKLRDRVNELEKKNDILYLENGELHKEVLHLRSENSLLKARVKELETKLEERNNGTI